MDPNHYNQTPQHPQIRNLQRQHQRFSWQDPATASNDDHQVYQQPQQHQQQQQQQQQSQSQVFQQNEVQQLLQIDTNPATLNRGFSYAQTPIEHRAFHYSPHEPLPNPLDTAVGQHPQTPHGQVESKHPQNIHPHEKPPAYETTNAVAHQQNTHGHHGHASFTPISSEEPLQVQTNVPMQSRHARQRSNLSPINTNVSSYAAPPPPVPSLPAGPLPPKSAITPISPVAIKHDPNDFSKPTSPITQTGPMGEPYTPHGFERNPVFSPHAAHGPNGLDFALHQPGQVSHPNMDLAENGAGKKWKFGLFSCTPGISDCMTGLFCPCIIYGRTSYRLSQKSNKKDPTDLLSYSATNGHCTVMGAACGLWWLFPTLQRMKIRHMYKIDGSCIGDFARGCCCCCCVAVQNEREVREREEKTRRLAGPASANVYSSVGGMVYKPQQ
ncbi:PLAC8-domain-containing protein [Aaosphaeria arxii CBS 175.79]|uniref:PLAC8-domain-containing protein n=1 Tax=Aaosphaeria arxii CBS 175.79 TaxID=1450172 RepID=A0A6A5X6K2_9PLEO|nr:PLAC8-domain-containing protein [Aaosphaeria arxii CBS 175.79]KAF2008414.1 PLAC8-domain-containing protein [Aaosphaeria arxii CBS 175.79]